MMRSHGQDAYADSARKWYRDLLGPYLREPAMEAKP